MYFQAKTEINRARASLFLSKAKKMSSKASTTPEL